MKTELIDMFAAAALQGMLSYSLHDGNNGNWACNCSEEGVAEIAYDYAEAMLKERKKRMDAQGAMFGDPDLW